MTDSLRDLLARRPAPKEPPDVVFLKNYVMQNYGQNVSVDIRDKTYVIKTRSASLASTLRFELHSLEKKLKTNKKLLVKII